MKKYIQKEKYLVSILLAAYNPNVEWFIKQLKSLNSQTYKNVELLVYDDCPNHPVDEQLIKNYISNFKYKIIRGKVNQGSNKAFEELTKVGQGKYFAYCDQDDIWEKNKIEVLVNTIKSEESVLAYSDMSVIDENSNFKYSSLLQAKPRLNYLFGDNLLNKLFFKNCISGCCMLVNAEVAKDAIPFSKVIVHDQWIAIVASIYGKISYIDSTLIRYRIHGNNQTGSLRGVFTKEDYYKFRILPLKIRLNELKEVIEKSGKQVNTFEIEEFCKARINRKLIKVFKYRRLCENEAYFEIILKYMYSYFAKYLFMNLK